MTKQVELRAAGVNSLAPTPHNSRPEFFQIATRTKEKTMTKIDTIQLTNFKNLDREIRLDTLNLLTGHNGSGKTALLSGLQFACEGNTKLGKQNDATALLAGPRGCGVSVALDNGFSWSRKLRINGDGTQQTLSIGGESKQKKNVAEEQLHGRVGSFAPMWDASREFFGMSPDKRRDYVVDLCGRATGGDGKIDPDEAVNEIAREFCRQHEDIGPATVEHFDSPLCELTAQYLSDRQRVELQFFLDTLTSDITGDPSEAIGAALSRAVELTNNAEREAREARLAADELEARKREIGAVAGSVEVLKRQIQDLNDARDSLIDKAAAMRERAKQIAEIDTRNAALTTELDNLKGTLAELEQLDSGISLSVAELNETKQRELLAADQGELKHLGDVEQQLKAKRAEQAELSAAIARMEQQVAACRPDTPESVEQQAYENLDTAKHQREQARKAAKEASSALEQLQAQRQSLTFDHREMTDKVQGITRQITDLEGKLTRHDNDPLTKIESALVELNQALQAGEVVNDQYVGNVVRKVQNIIAEHREAFDADTARTQLESLQEDRVTINADIDATGTQLDELDARIKTASETSEAALHKLQEAESAYEKSSKAYDERLAVARALRDIEPKRSELEAVDHELKQLEGQNKRRIDLEQNVTKHDEALQEAVKKTNRIRNAAEARRSANDRIEQINTTLKDDQESRDALVEANDGKDVDYIESERLKVEEDIAALEERLDVKQRADTLTQEIVETQARAEARTLRHETGKLVVKAIKVQRETLTKKLVAPLIDHMNAFLAGVSDDLTAFIELDNPTGKKVVFRMGWVWAEQQVHIEAMSGGETAIFTAALAYALVQLADPPLKLLLIEAGEIDTENMVALLDAIASVQHNLDNVLIATYQPVAAASGWNVIDMAAGAGASVMDELAATAA